MWYSKDQLTSRSTRDVDFALYVSGKEQFENVRRKLVSECGFKAIKGDQFRLQTPFGFPVDFIPFGAISIDEAVQAVGVLGSTAFINAFEEIYHKATVEVVGKNKEFRFRIATLPAIFIMKLIAYDDRPELRTQDPNDMADIIENYFRIEQEMIWQYQSDLFDIAPEADLAEIGCIAIGREISKITEENSTLRNRIRILLSLNQQKQKRMAEIIAGNRRSLQEAENWFRLIRSGFEGE